MTSSINASPKYSNTGTSRIIRLSRTPVALAIIKFLNSRNNEEVEQWSDNKTFSISVAQSPLGACILYGTIGPVCYVRPECVLYDGAVLPQGA